MSQQRNNIDTNDLKSKNPPVSTAEVQISEDTKSLQSEQDTTSEQKWTKVLRKRSRKFIVGQNKEIQHIQGVPKRLSLHVTRLAPNTKPEELKNFLIDKFPEVTCEPHNSKHPDIYKSMKVSINQENLKNVWRKDVWPNGALVTQFFHKRKLPDHSGITTMGKSTDLKLSTVIPIFK